MNAGKELIGSQILWTSIRDHFPRRANAIKLCTDFLNVAGITQLIVDYALPLPEWDKRAYERTFYHGRELDGVTIRRDAQMTRAQRLELLKDDNVEEMEITLNGNGYSNWFRVYFRVRRFVAFPIPLQPFCAYETIDSQKDWSLPFGGPTIDAAPDHSLWRLECGPASSADGTRSQSQTRTISSFYCLRNDEFQLRFIRVPEEILETIAERRERLS